jgi:anhydro-N-acetylmuramic acid kinase
MTPRPGAETRLVAGCMTGTSIDSLDAALLEINRPGLEMRARFVRGITRELGELKPRLRALADQQPLTAGEIAGIAHEFALLHAAALRDLAAEQKLDLICVHGQTVFHKPPLSWQVMQPAPIAHALKCPVVYDLRSADLAAGGQGAPITPIADWVFFRDMRRSVVVVNLGGFCNVSFVPSIAGDEEFGRRVQPTLDNLPQRSLSQKLLAAAAAGPLARVTGTDVCPCNQLLDAIARTLMHVPFDDDGRIAASGEPRREAQEDLDGIFRSLQRQRRSLGTGDETSEWISRWRSRVSPADLAATACEVIALHIAAEADERDILLAGGGVRNKALRSAIESCCSARVRTTDEVGLPHQYREAACFAVLGALCQDRIPITLPQVTGAPEPAPISGAWVIP